jgi:hypothetical protein
MKKIKLTGKHGSVSGNFALVDDADFAAINYITWSAHFEHGTVFAVEVLQKGGGNRHKRYMHKMLAPAGRFTHHRNGNSLDNRRNNLTSGTASNTGKTRFSPGSQPWNKGKPGYDIGSRSPQWRGDDVGYYGLHSWVYRRLGKAKVCEDCGSLKNVQWANRSKKYLRRVSDWRQLCVVCHRRYDGITKLSREQAAAIRNAHTKGVPQQALAEQYNVSQSTISNVIRRKIQFYG